MQKVVRTTNQSKKDLEDALADGWKFVLVVKFERAHGYCEINEYILEKKDPQPPFPRIPD